MITVQTGVKVINLENKPLFLEQFTAFYLRGEKDAKYLPLYLSTWAGVEHEANLAEPKDKNFLVYGKRIPDLSIMFVNVNLAEEFAKEMQVHLTAAFKNMEKK